MNAVRVGRLLAMTWARSLEFLRDRAATFQPLLSYACVAAIYFALCFPLTLWSRSLEDKLNGAR